MQRSLWMLEAEWDEAKQLSESKDSGGHGSEKHTGGTGKEPHEMSKQEYVALKTAEPGQSGMARFHGQMHVNHVAAAVADGKMMLEQAKKHYPSIADHPVVRGAIKSGKIEGPVTTPSDSDYKGPSSSGRGWQGKGKENLWRELQTVLHTSR